jgi:uncharacterized protein YjeT (DUF2065 family)
MKTKERTPMSHSAISVLVFGIYMVINGLGLLLQPNALLALFGFEPTSEVWLRLAGLLSVSLGLYYILAARAELTLLFYWSVFIRPLGLLGMIILVWANLAKPTLIGFGLGDLLSALWTWQALKQADKRALA